jgi:uncharacterized protein (TIGR02118 family)
MVRLLVLYGQPTDPAAFDRHYREVHVPLARKLPGLRRYTISAGVRALQGTAPYLVAELDFDDRAAFRQAMEAPEGRAVAADLPGFATGGATLLLYEVEDVTA